MAEDATPRPPAPGDAPIDMAVVKDDLGIAPTDTSNDAWLQRRVNGLWARIETYCNRKLTLGTTFADDWGEIAQNQPNPEQPPRIMSVPRGTVFMRQFPVQAVTKVSSRQGGSLADSDPTAVIFDGDSGKLISLDGVLDPGTGAWVSVDAYGAWRNDLGPRLVRNMVRIEYTAGFDVLPSDLYEALIGALTIQWNVRSATQQGLGVGGFMPTRVLAFDVGRVDLNLTANVLVDAASKGTKDPLLGPFAELLEPYVDYRSMIGGAAYPITTVVPTTPRQAALVAP